MTTPHRYDLAPAEPEEVGLDPAAVTAFLTAVERRRPPLHSLLVMRRGRVVVERYGDPWTAQTPHRLYSISKSFASVGIGWCIGAGLLTLDDKVIDHFGEHHHDQLHPWTAAMTVRDLLTMSTAHGETTYKDANDTNLVRTFFTVEPTRPPGRLFSYDTSASVVLGALVERLTGRSLSGLLSEVLWPALRAEGPLRALRTPSGLSPDQTTPGSPVWREVVDNPRGTDHAGSGLLCTPRDLARFVMFCGDGGRVDDRQVVPADYLAAATSQQVDIDLRSGHDEGVFVGYGYQFWRTPYDGFSGVGMGGQLALVHPEQDLVVVTTGDDQGIATLDTHVLPLVWDHLLPALDDTGPTQLARYGTIPGSVPAGELTSPLAASVTGAEYRFDPSPHALSALRLDLDHDHGVLTLTDDRFADRLIEFGLGQWRPFRFPRHDLPARACGRWRGEDRFRISVRIEGDFLARVEIGLVFGKDRTVTVQMSRAAEAFLDEYQTVATSTAR